MRILQTASVFLILIAAAATPAAADPVDDIAMATQRACAAGPGEDCLAALAALESAVGAQPLSPAQVERVVAALIAASNAVGTTAANDAVFATVMSSVMTIAAGSLPVEGRQAVIGSVWSVTNSASGRISSALIMQTLMQAETIMFASGSVQGGVPMVARFPASPL